MKVPNPPNDAVSQYMAAAGVRVVAGSGRPGDRWHLGKLLLQGLRDDPNFILQINAASGESETCGTVLDKSIRCAVALQRMGLQQGDVISVLTTNHLDACVPIYAALSVGMIIAPLEMTSNANDLKTAFTKIKPKLIFCQSAKGPETNEAIKDFDMKPKIITFDGESNTLKNLLQSVEDEAVMDFKAADIDPETCSALLVPTSGTTGLPKHAELTHKNIAIAFPTFWIYHTKFPTPTERVLVWGYVRAVTTLQLYLMSPILKFTRVQSSAQNSEDHCIEVVNKYKPTLALMFPTYWARLLNIPHCDISSFKTILLGSCAVPKELLVQTKERAPNARVQVGYGLTESSSTVFVCLFSDLIEGAGWFEMSHLQYRLVDLDTLDVITEPNVNGELWVKGSTTFKGYYNDPKATKEVITEDNWLRTGDIFFKDQNNYYHFVERFKMLMKYNRITVYPLEVEEVVRQHPGVLDVAVTGIPDPDMGDLVVACVVAKPGSSITAQDIKDVVKDKLAHPKQLHGGVLFLKVIPLLASGKVDRKKLRQLVQSSPRQ